MSVLFYIINILTQIKTAYKIITKGDDYEQYGQAGTNAIDIFSRGSG